MPGLVVSMSGNFVEVDEGRFFLVGDFRGPFHISGFGPFDETGSIPRFSRYERTNNRRRTFGARVTDEFPQIPSIGMHDLMFLGHDIVDFFGFFPNAFDRAARAKRPRWF